MANGQLPGRVAPTSIGQGKSYSQMMNEQIGLIQQQRAANLDKRLAQEEKNRQFRTEQLQNIYDFDVSGLASGDVQVLADVQRQLAASLDPNSENSYSSSQQLVADISLINNAYNEMKRWAETGMSGRQAYQQGVLNPDRGDGTVFVGDEDTLSQKNSVWERGAFAEGSVRLVGPPGNRQLVGMALDVDGNEIGEIGFFENSMRNQPDQFWRPEVVEAAYMDIASAYADNANVDITNVDQRAASDWDHNPVKIQEKYRRDKARREGLSMDDITNDDGTFQDGYTDEDLRAEYISEARSGVETLRKKQTQDPLFDPQRTTSGLTNLKEKITLNVEDEEFAGTIIAADYVKGLGLEELIDADGNIVIPIQVAYVGAGNVVRKQTIDPSNPAYQQLIQQMGESGINEMFDRAGYEIASAGDASTTGATGADPSPQQIDIADLEQQRLDILEGTGDNEGMRAIEERAEQLKQEAIDSASEEVGFFGRMAGNESKSDLEARPITDFMSPAERLAYNQAQKDLAAIDAQLGRESSQASGGTDDQALQDLEGPATERDLSGLPTISPIARSASDSIAISEGYSPDLQINVPDTINSGVTIAGLDIGGLNPEGDSVKMDILERYLSPEDFSALKQLVGLKGSEAQKKLEEFQSQGLLQQDGLGLTEQDIIDIPALYVSAVELPRIYKIIPEEEFASLPSEIRNVVLDVQFNVHGPRTLKKIREAIKSGDKASWMEVANAYYNPETGATYFGSKEQTQQKIDSGNIGRGNVKRVKAARENLLAWIEKTYG